MIFALITVVITVHAFVFYSLYVINGNSFMQITGENSVLSAINAMGGVYMLGKAVPIWAVILIEFCIAYTLAVLVGSPLSFKLVCRLFSIGEVHHVIFDTAMVVATVCIMCPSMSFIAAILYYPYETAEFSVFTLLAEWLKLICFNLPFAFFSQLLFIQPFVRKVFKLIFSKDIAARKSAEKNGGNAVKA